MGDWFSSRSILYRLALGAVVLSIVLPVWASGFQPMWLIAIVAITVVTALGVLMARRPRIGGWLRR